MRDILMDGIPVLDLLEITASTGVVAALSNCDQSSVSRTYRRVSAQLGLEFRKTRGRYRAHANPELLRALRQAAQLLRLERGCGQLRWLAAADAVARAPSGSVAAPLPRSWQGEHRTLELVRERVLDLAVVNRRDGLPPGWDNHRQPFHFGDWVALELEPARRPAGHALLLRQDRSDHPTLQALIQQLQDRAAALQADPLPA